MFEDFDAVVSHFKVDLLQLDLGRSHFVLAEKFDFSPEEKGLKSFT